MRDETEITILDADDDCGPQIPVADFLKSIADAVAAMPAEVRDQAFVRLVAYGDYAKAYLHIDRPATKAEQEADNREMAERAEAAVQERKAREFAEYQRLKAKFGLSDSIKAALKAAKV